MEALFDCLKRITAFADTFWCNIVSLILNSENDPCLQRICIPTRNICGYYRLIKPWCDAEEIDHRDPVFEGFTEPTIVGGIRIIPHEGIIDGFATFEYLAMYLSLIIVPDTLTRTGKHRPDRKKILHLLWLENTSLRVD